jgi:penicillin-binding protein 2
MSAEDHPLLNRAIQAQLAPGSVYKIPMATAGLESGNGRLSTTYLSRSASFLRAHLRVGNLRATVASACQAITLRRVLHNLGKDMGIDKIAGIRPTPPQDRHRPLTKKMEPGLHRVVAKTYRKRYAGNHFGRYRPGWLTVTPVQLAYAIGGIASGGNFARPRLVTETGRAGPAAPPIEMVKVTLNDATIATVTDGMWGVVNEGGTGQRASLA